jgi:RND family efflux transporter MFP subunit
VPGVSSIKRHARVVLPIFIIVIGIAIAWLLIVNSPRAHRKPTVVLPPMVQVQQIQPQDIRIPVFSQGTVKPATSSNLSAEVTGQIINASTHFADGDFFKKGEILLRINPSDYQLAITKAEAQVASAKQQLAKAEAEYKQKVEEYKGVDSSKITDYALRKPQYEEAKATLKAATADLDLARVQLKRCDIRAPFDGRVVQKKADIGQYVMPGTVLASVYATDIAEVRLPLTETQISLVGIPLVGGDQLKEHPVNVRLTGIVGSQKLTWKSRIVRTEAMIDERNRLQYVVAQVNDPYGIHGSKSSQPVMTAGMFVEAEIEGRQLQGIYVLPRTALHNKNTVWILDKDSHLEMRDVKVVYRGENNVYVKGGLNPGDNIITSPLDSAVEGMRLRVVTSASSKG